MPRAGDGGRDSEVKPLPKQLKLQKAGGGKNPRGGVAEKKRKRLWLAGDFEEVFEGINAGVVAVGPDGLDAVAADGIEPGQFEGDAGKGFRGVFVNVAEDVGFAGAAGAGAGAAEFFERNKILMAILPFDGQFISNRLNVGRAHGSKISGWTVRRPHNPVWQVFFRTKAKARRCAPDLIISCHAGADASNFGGVQP